MAPPDESNDFRTQVVDEKRRFFEVVTDIAKIAVPNMMGYILNLVNEFTNTVFLGRTGDDAALAGIGLGNTMQNCFGLSIGFGIASAMDTLVSQAYGANQHDLCCAYLQRARILVTLQLAWMIPVLWFSEDWLVAIGQQKEVAHWAAEYNEIAVFGLFGVFQFETQRKFLQNRCVTLAPALICAICSMLHVGWCALFIDHFDLKTAGAGYANVITWTSEFLLCSAYLFFVAPGMGLRRRAVLWIDKSAFRDWLAFTHIAFPSTLQMCAEWWFWEICALVAGYLGDVALAAHTATLNFVGVSFMPVIGMSTSAATLVGNAVGANQPLAAKQNLWVSVGINALLWLCLAIVMFTGRKVISTMYSADHAVQDLECTLLSIFALVGFFDATQNVMGGALRGLGKQNLAVGVYVLAFYGLMLPLGCLCAFPWKFGVQGLWVAMGSGTFVAMIMFGIYLCRVNFTKVALEASAQSELAAIGMKRESRELTQEYLIKDLEVEARQ